MTASVLCIGIATLDFVYAVDAMPTVAEKYHARDLAIVSGGTAANAAVAIARLGGTAVLASRLGDDLVAAEILRALRAEGVDCAYVRGFPEMRSAVSTILVDALGERMVVSYRDRPFPADPGWLPAELPHGIGAVLSDVRWEEAGIRFFAAARAEGRPRVLDADRAPRDPALIANASHVAFGAQGLRELTGTSDPRAGLRSLRDREGWFAVTVGAEGVFYLEDGEVRHEPAFPVKAVDTLAAGDTWHGAFALCLAEGASEREAVRFASATSALKCMRFGGHRGAPRRREVEAFLSGRD